MKTFISFLIILNLVYLIHSQNVNFETQIDRSTFYQQSSISCKNNKLILTSQGSIEQYNYSTSGIFNNEYILPTYGDCVINFILEDTLFVIRANQNKSFFEKYRLTDYSPQFVTNNTTTFNKSIFRVKYNNNYIFAIPFSGNHSYIFNINNLTLIDSIQVGFEYEVKNNIIFFVSSDESNNSITLNISDISDIHNPINVSNLILNGVSATDFLSSIKYKDNHLFMLFTHKLLIIDVTDFYNPFEISRINSFPELDQTNNWNENILFYNNYLIISNDSSKIWFYNISNIAYPVFVRIYNFLNTYSLNIPNPFRHIIIDEENNLMFTSTFNYKISSWDNTDLNNISHVDMKGAEDESFWNHSQLFNDKLIYNLVGNSYSKLFLYDINSSEKTLLDTFGFNFFYNSENDSIFCFRKYNPHTNNFCINFYKSINDTLNYIGELPNQSGFNEESTIIGNNILKFDNNIINIYSLKDNEFLHYLGTISPGVNFSVVSNKNIYPEYIFISYNSGNTTKIRIYNNTPPFGLSSEFYVLFPDTYKIYFLNHDLLIRESNDYTKFLLSYQFPNNFVILDTLIDNTKLLFSNNKDDIIYGFAIQNGIVNHSVIKFIPIQNNRFGTSFSYDFHYLVNRIFFIPEDNIFLVVGKFFIQEYSYQLTGSEDDYITPISKPIMLNYPNPFNPTTTISFNSEKRIKNTQIAIYNLKGQKIRDISVENCKTGKNKVVWDGKDNSGKKVANGVYLYSLKQNGKTIATKKMLMLK